MKKENKQEEENPCKHKKLVKDRVLGADTGDYICLACKEAKPRHAWKAREDGEGYE